MRRPVVRLKKALYGHPDSGTFWEKHCDMHVRKVGFLPVGEEWPSCYHHPVLKLYLVIYVDDFKLAGPTINLKTGWSLLEKGLTIEPPTPVGVYLGCGHEVGTIKVGGTLARTVTYNMEDFLTSCVSRYLELAGPGTKLRAVSTPFLAEDMNTSLVRKPLHEGPSIKVPLVRSYLSGC